MNLTVQTIGRVALGGIALSISPAPKPPAPSPPTEFADVWTDAVKAIAVHRVVREIELVKPRPVATETFLPQAAYVEPPPLPMPTIKSRPKPIDVCAEHRMKKVWYGKVWRCRR